MSAAGTATRLDATINGNGQAQLSQLTARDVHLVISGSGLIEVTATASLDAAVPGLRHDHLQWQPGTGHHQRHRLRCRHPAMSSDRHGRHGLRDLIERAAVPSPSD